MEWKNNCQLPNPVIEWVLDQLFRWHPDFYKQWENIPELPADEEDGEDEDDDNAAAADTTTTNAANVDKDDGKSVDGINITTGQDMDI